MRRVHVLFAVVVSAAFVAGCGGSTGGAARVQAPVDWRGRTHVDVDATSDRFVSADVVISPGTTVTWHNRDTVVHNIRAASGAVGFGGTFGADSAAFGPGATYAYTFAKLGDYPYTCTIHPGMTGSIRVVA